MFIFPVPQPPLPTPLRWLAALPCVLCALGCADVSARAQRFARATAAQTGLVDPTTQSPRGYVLLCDTSAGAGCSEPVLDQIIPALARFTFSAPGSSLSVVAMGSTVGETNEVASVSAPPAPARSRDREAALGRFIETARNTLCVPLRSQLSGARPRRSPIVESIAKVALARNTNLPLSIVVVSDAVEDSRFGSFGCGPLPTPTAWATPLQRRGVLPAGSLSGVSVHFVLAHAGPQGSRRCAPSVGRERAIRTLWQHALTRAGATTVTFASSPNALVNSLATTMTTTGGSR